VIVFRGPLDARPDIATEVR